MFTSPPGNWALLKLLQGQQLLQSCCTWGVLLLSWSWRLFGEGFLSCAEAGELCKALLLLLGAEL